MEREVAGDLMLDLVAEQPMQPRQGVEGDAGVGVMLGVIRHVPHPPADPGGGAQGPGAMQLGAVVGEAGVLGHQVQAEEDMSDRPDHQDGPKARDEGEAEGDQGGEEGEDEAALPGDPGRLGGADEGEQAAPDRRRQERAADGEHQLAGPQQLSRYQQQVGEDIAGPPVQERGRGHDLRVVAAVLGLAVVLPVELAEEARGLQHQGGAQPDGRAVERRRREGGAVAGLVERREEGDVREAADGRRGEPQRVAGCGERPGRRHRRGEDDERGEEAGAGRAVVAAHQAAQGLAGDSW